MRIDKEKLSAMANLSDAELWRTVETVAAKNGVKLPIDPPPPSEMQKLREAMQSPDRLSTLGALKLISKYKKG